MECESSNVLWKGPGNVPAGLAEVTPNQCLQSHVSAFRARRARGLADSMICIVHFSLRGIPLWKNEDTSIMALPAEAAVKNDE